MIASTGSKIVSISRIPVSLIVSRIEALIASTASDDCKRLHLAHGRLKTPGNPWRGAQDPANGFSRWNGRDGRAPMQHCARMGGFGICRSLIRSTAIALCSRRRAALRAQRRFRGRPHGQLSYPSAAAFSQPALSRGRQLMPG